MGEGLQRAAKAARETRKRPTKTQLGIQKGDYLIVTKDDGTRHHGVAESAPWQLGGHTWVVLVSGISGAYDLTRCRKMVAKACTEKT